MLVRQVQAHEVSRHCLREVRRRSDPVEGPARAHGPYRAGLACRPHLVPQVGAVAHRALVRHDAQGDGASPLFRELCRHRAGIHLAQPVPAAYRGSVPPRAGRVRCRCLRGRNWGRGDPKDAGQARSRRGAGHAAGRARRHQLRGQAQEAGQAAEAGRILHPLGQPAGVDDPRGGAGDSAGAPPTGAAGRRSASPPRTSTTSTAGSSTATTA